MKSLFHKLCTSPNWFVQKFTRKRFNDLNLVLNIEEKNMENFENNLTTSQLKLLITRNQYLLQQHECKW